MLNVLAWIIAGLIIGGVARLLIPGQQSMTVLMTMVLGIAGALVGGAVSWMIWGHPGEPFSSHSWPGYFLSIIGAVVVLGIYLNTTRRATV